MQIITSLSVRVNIDVEPNKVVQTSPDTFELAEKMLRRRYPKASADTDNMAIAASPLIFAFCPDLSKTTAEIIVIGSVNNILSARLSTVPIAIAPKATWDSPSPIKENLLSTSVTPISDEHIAINKPTIIAYLTNECSR